MIAATATASAQGNGLAGMTEATSMVSSYFEPATKLIYAIGAVIGLIGGVKVYSKFSSCLIQELLWLHMQECCLYMM